MQDMAENRQIRQEEDGERFQLKSARFLARDVLRRAVRPGDAAVDATMGNGHDTLFLCSRVGENGRVYAFDIQEKAVRATEQLLRENGMLDRARLHCAGHERMAEFVREPVQAAVFNLGWLPGGDHGITTHWETTEQAVQSALDLLSVGGVLVICAYPGHPEGERERERLTGFLSALSNRRFNVLHQRFLNAGEGAPECFVIQKER